MRLRARALYLGIGAAVFFALLAADPRVAFAQNLEYAVKANFLYKFSPFVVWPEASFPEPTSPLVICVAGNDPLGPVLDDAVAKQKNSTRPIEVRRFAEIRAVPPCHILYIAGSAAQDAASVLQTVRGAPILTITDDATNPSARGIIHFVIQGNHVRFDINDAAAQVNRITLSSKILSLARNITARRSP